MDGVIQILLGNTYMADGTNAGGRCTEISINGSALVQEVNPLRGTTKLFYDRGDQSDVLRFRIATEWPSVAQALAFIGSLRGNIAGVAAVTVMISSSSDSATLAGGGKWSPIERKVIGQTSLVDYTVESQLLQVTYAGTPPAGGEGSGGGSGGSGGGSGPPLFVLPAVALSVISPLVVASGATATLDSGELCACIGLKVQGQLILNAGSRLLVLAA